MCGCLNLFRCASFDGIIMPWEITESYISLSLTKCRCIVMPVEMEEGKCECKASRFVTGVLLLSGQERGLSLGGSVLLWLCLQQSVFTAR